MSTEAVDQAEGPELEVGAVLGGRYRVVRFVGSGGMGDVYAAHDELVDQAVAVKLVRSELLWTPGVRDTLRSEVRLSQRVTHPNVARTYTLEEVEGRSFVVMELLQGTPLDQLLEKGPLQPTRAAEIAADVLRALEAAHAIGVVHRDIKPGNVMLCADGRVVVMDFGIARHFDTVEPVDPEAAPDATSLAGTPAYMAPEVCRGAQASAASDLYSFGAMLFEMLAGRPPFEQQNTMALLLAHVTETPPKLETVRPGTPAHLVRLVARLLEKSPEARPDLAETLLLVSGSPRPRPSAVTRYARVGRASIAYQHVGERPEQLVVLPGFVSHVEHQWEHPSMSAFLESMLDFASLVLVDRRGTGMSDPVIELPSIDQRVDDLIAVLDKCGVERAGLLAMSEAGPVCLRMANRFPERVSAVVLLGSFAKGGTSPEWPHGIPREGIDMVLGLIDDAWGTGVTAQVFAPTQADEPSFRESWGRLERLSASPGAARRMIEMAWQSDAMDEVPKVAVPVQIIHRAGDLVVPVAGARRLSELLQDCEYVELEGPDHLAFVGNIAEVLEPMRDFLARRATTPGG